MLFPRFHVGKLACTTSFSTDVLSGVFFSACSVLTVLQVHGCAAEVPQVVPDIRGAAGCPSSHHLLAGLADLP